MTDVIGTEQVAKATALLQRYKTGKAALDKRIVDIRIRRCLFFI